MKTLRNALVKISLKQPTEAIFGELEVLLDPRFERRFLLNSLTDTPTHEVLPSGEYWLASTTRSANDIAEEVRQATAKVADAIRALNVVIVNEYDGAANNLTWEQGWEKLRAIHAA